MRHFFLTAAAIVATCATAAAADLAVAEAPAPAASSINGYVQLLGGWVMPNTLTSVPELSLVAATTVDFDAGWALGATFGLETPIDGLSVEVDVLRTWADTEGVSIETAGSLISTSLMANAVYSVDLNDMFSLYGGAGLGMIALEAAPDDETLPVGTGSGAGYQVFAGVQADVAENVALTLEGRYQSSFDNIEMSVDGLGTVGEQEFNRTSVLVGLLFSF
jgi:opacity protein-like surface antigen